MERKRMKPGQMLLLAHRLANADFHYMLGDELTANLLRIDPKVAAKMRKTQHYRERVSVLQGMMDKSMTELMRKDADRLRLAMSDMMPQAIEVIRQKLADSDPAIALRAAQEVLDRDGRMPKVSKMQTSLNDASTLPDVDPEVAKEFRVN